jgi:RNA polymerase sigma factor, sigma-70 family
MLEERRMAEQLKKKEPEALRRVMERYGNDVLRTAALLLKDAHLAEDIAQETFLTAYERANQYRGEGSLRGWLLQIAVNLCRARMRRASWKRLLLLGAMVDAPPPRRQHRRETDAGTTPAAATSSGGFEAPGSDRWADSVSLRKELERLPLPYREVTVLHYYQELQVKEIAAVLKEPEGTVKSKLLRARKRLKKQLEEGDWNDEQTMG